MFKKISKLKNISEDLFYFLQRAVENCINEIEDGALKFQRHLGQFEDINKSTDDNDLLDLLEVRVCYIDKLRHHYWVYENNYNKNDNVFDLVSVYFNNSVLDKFHYSTCENLNIEDSNDYKEDCDCYNDFFHAVAYDISEYVNKRYEEVCDLQEKYEDLHYEVSDRIENKEE